MSATIPGAPPEHSVEGEATGRDQPARTAPAPAVEPRHVVRGELESADRRLAAEAAARRPPLPPRAHHARKPTSCDRPFNDAGCARPALPARGPNAWRTAAVARFAPSDWTIIPTMIQLSVRLQLPLVE